MKRVDVLKGIEQVLVQKAYETGHISHRTDGDWQKQADGSWKPYAGQPTQNPNKKDRYGFNLLPDEDKQGYLDRASGDPYQAQILYEKDVENSPMGGLDEEEDQYDEITEEDLVETPIKNKLSKEEKADINNKIDRVFSTYDEDAEKLFGRRRSNGGGYIGDPKFYCTSDLKIKPTSDKKEVDKIVRFYMDKAGIEDTPLNYKQAYKVIIGQAYNNKLIGDYDYNKVYRDMRSVPATKNMGF